MTTKTKKNPKGIKVTREVELDLNPAVHAKLASELGEKLKAQTKLNTEWADVQTKWKERRKPITERIAAINNFFENGKEKKTVECVQVKNYEDNTVEFWFEGKVVDHRPMTVVDRQDDLSLKTKRGRSKENSVVMPPPTEDEEISNVRKLETSKRTKHSSVDGPTTTATHPAS